MTTPSPAAASPSARSRATTTGHLTGVPHPSRVEDRRERYCVIGAGSGGLTAAKNLLQVGVEVDVIEREQQVGGIWNPHSPTTPAYRSIHLITSKPYIEYTDFPIPADEATYLGLDGAHAYLASYARAFGVDQRLELGRTVERVERVDGHRDWLVTLDGGEVRRYGGVVIAHGHNSVPRYPSFPGRFDGEAMHAAEYDVPSVLAGKRVLVVGGGTSGADIAVESSQHAAATYLSIRRGCYYWPKYVMGVPTDHFYEGVLRMRLPRPVLRQFAKAFLRLSSAGDPASYGLPHPPHKLLEEHFAINSTLLYHLGHGRIAVRPDIAALDGRQVRFVDGRTEEIDLIVYATGYEQTQFPFIDRRHLNWPGRIPELHLHLFHPDYDNLFVIGYFQTSTGNWRIMDYQAQLMARFVHLNRHDPAAVAWLRAEKGRPRYGAALNGGISFYDSERHWLQVEHVSFRSHLRRRIRRLDEALARTPATGVPAVPTPVAGAPVTGALVGAGRA